MTRQSPLWMFLLTMLVGCPSEWGQEGRIHKAVERDMFDVARKSGCSLDEAAWKERCTAPDKRTCPSACWVADDEDDG